MVWETRVLSTTGKDGRKTERINKLAGSLNGAPVLNPLELRLQHPRNFTVADGYRKLLESDGTDLKQATESLRITEALRKRLRRKPCEITREQMDAVKEKLVGMLHLNGNGKKNGFEAMQPLATWQPITEKQSVELAYYLYLKVRRKSDKSNPDLALEMKSCQPNFMESVRAMEALSPDEKRKAKGFFTSARKESIRAASLLVEKRHAFDSGILRLWEAQKKELALQEEHRSRMMTAISEKYASRKGTYGTIMEKKVPPLSKILPYAVPLGGAIVAVAQGVPIEYVTLGLAGLWLLAFGAKNIAIDLWLAFKRDKVKVSAEKEKAKASEEIREKEDEIRADYVLRIKSLQEAFETDKKVILSGVCGAYRQLLSEQGYSAAA